MAQVIGNTARGTTGLMLALGPNGVGQILILVVPTDANTINDGGDLNPGCINAAPGSLAIRLDNGQHQIKGTNGTWTTLTVP